MEGRNNQLLLKITERNSEVDRFIDVSHNQADWFTSPVSTQYQLNKEVDLLKHSVRVTETLLRMHDALAL